jgi:hypothetical protein
MGRAAVAVLLTFATSSSGCATMNLSVPGAWRRPIASQHYDPVGRWDVVMALRRGSVIRVATKDGALHTGRYVGSVVHGLLLETDIEVQIARRDVLQVDLLKDLRYRSMKRSILGGAASGALAFGAYEVTLGLLFAGSAHMPALRTWALGAATGAGLGALGAATARPRTIYISPAP